MERTLKEQQRIEEMLFVSVKEEPADEDSMHGISTDELEEEKIKHEETEITDVQDQEEDTSNDDQKSKSTHIFVQLRDNPEDLTASPPPRKRIKEEIPDSPLEEDEDEDEVSQSSAPTTSIPYSCIICENSFTTPKDVNEHSKTVHNFSCCEYCLEHYRRYSCSFKGNNCSHEYKVSEATVTSDTAAVTGDVAVIIPDNATVTTDS